MVNSNPETVSTDYDTSDRLYFEPLTLEDVLNVIEAERPEGVIVQFGGQTPLKLALPLLRWLESEAGQVTGTRLWGTSPRSIDLAEDREQFEAVLRRLAIRQPANGIARSEAEAMAAIWGALTTAVTEDARQALIARHGAALVKSFNSYATLMRKLGLEGPYA